MKILLSRICLQVIVIVCACASPALADENLTKLPEQQMGAVARTSLSVPSGSYQVFNIGQKFTLGATALVHASTAKQARVVFAYQPKDVFENQPVDLIVKNLELGLMNIGYFDDLNTKDQIIVDEKATEEFLMTLKESGLPVGGLDAEKLSSTAMFLTSQKNVLGTQTVGKWISWQPSLQSTLPDNKLLYE